MDAIITVPSAPRRIAELDGWRGVSILLVLAGHLIAFRHFENFRGLPHLTDLGDMLSRLGVHIFFCISGFVITRVLLQQEHSGGRLSFRWFYLRRAFKILPVLGVYLMALWLLWIAGLVNLAPASLIKAALFACNTDLSGDCHYFVEHTWSLAVEEQFYLAYPLILMLLPRATRTPALLVLLVAFIGISLVKVYFHTGNWIDNGEAFACIAAGTLLALNEQWLLHRLPCVRRADLIALLIMMLLLRAPHHRWTTVSYELLSPFLIAGMLMLCMHRAADERSVFNSRPLQFFGLISYSLYVWQQLFMGREFQYLTDAWWLRSTAVAIAVGAGGYWLIERPLTRLGRQLSDRWR